MIRALLLSILCFVIAIGVAIFTAFHVPHNPNIFEWIGILFCFGISIIFAIAGSILGIVCGNQ